MKKRVTPYKGAGNYYLYSSLSSIKDGLKQSNTKYTEELWSNDECTNPVPWTVLRAENGLALFFAKDCLFKINITSSDYELDSGICPGIEMEKARILDDGLIYDDWEEDWQSPKGYWIEDDPASDKILSISIFIQEVLDDDEFDKYEWCKASQQLL